MDDLGRFDLVQRWHSNIEQDQDNVRLHCNGFLDRLLPIPCLANDGPFRAHRYERAELVPPWSKVIDHENSGVTW